ncbi:uncharacterized protein TNCV_3990751 [Trichonephila clavipes]|uniref:Transposase n=1 Tax=Trichonephila clavipes TaxID=2585209 RepID=A0A8X6SZH3_TRICX|nr:uncharacterized protein TNCV_3990751 [Trichonephila clavipes]
MRKGIRSTLRKMTRTNPSLIIREVGFNRGIHQTTASNYIKRLGFRSERGCGSPVFKVSDRGRHVMSSSPVPLKTHCVGQRCPLNMSRTEMSSRWCGVVVRRGYANSGVIHVTWPWLKITCSVTQSPRVAEQCDVIIHSLIRI